MINTIPKTKTLKIGNKKLTFCFNLKAFFKLIDTYGNKEALYIFNSILSRQSSLINIIKILAVSCINEDIDVEFLSENIPLNKKALTFYSEITFYLMDGYILETTENMINAIDNNEDVKKK